MSEPMFQMNDLSDEAALKYWDQITGVGPKEAALMMWREAARRALERERKAFEAGMRKVYDEDNILPDDIRQEHYDHSWLAYQEKKE